MYIEKPDGKDVEVDNVYYIQRMVVVGHGEGRRVDNVYHSKQIERKTKMDKVKAERSMLVYIDKRYGTTSSPRQKVQRMDLRR